LRAAATDSETLHTFRIDGLEKSRS